MKVQELIDELKTCDPEAEVIMSKDSEGNSYSPCDSYNNECRYVPESTWYGSLISPQDVAEGSYDQEDFDKAHKCVVLWPTN